MSNLLPVTEGITE